MNDDIRLIPEEWEFCNGLEITFDLNEIKNKFQSIKAKNKKEVVVNCNGITKEFTFDDFVHRLGFDCLLEAEQEI